MNEQFTGGRLPVLALRGIAIFPQQTVHFDIGRVKSALALEDAMKKDQLLMLVPQKDILIDDPDFDDLFPVGTVVKVKQILRANGENIRVLVTGVSRAKVIEETQSTPFLSGVITKLDDVTTPETLRTKALCREATALYGIYSDLLEHPVQGTHLRIMASDSCTFIADTIAQNSGIEYREKAKLLCQLNPIKRIESAIRLLRQEVQMLQIESDIQEKTKVQIDQDQRDYYLREQIKAIKDELGESDEYAEFFEYEKQIRQLKLSEKSEQKVLKDLDRLKKQPFGSAEASVLRNYLDTVLELPWGKYSKEKIDIITAKNYLLKIIKEM